MPPIPFLSLNETIPTIFPQPSANSTNQTTPEPSQETGEPYIWLLFVDLFIFCFLTYSTYISTKKKVNEADNTGGFRINFLKWLVLANGMRALSLLFIIVFGNPNGDNRISWLNSILHAVPAFMFVSTYMNYAVFLADLYYNSISYSNFLFKPILVLMVNGGYVLLLIIGLVTLVISKFHFFFTVSELLMAILYLVLGSIILYFGRKVSLLCGYKSQKFDSNDTDNKTKIISYSLGGLFELKGLTGILGGFGLFDPKNHNVYDFLWFLVLEILPTLIFMYCGRMSEESAASPRVSFVSEGLEGETRFSQGRRSSANVQFYE